MVVRKEKTAEDIKRLIILEIRHKYQMNVDEFAHSKVAEPLNEKPKTLKNSLSSGTTSYPLMKKLFEFLDMGVLDRKITVVKKVAYSIK